MKKNSNNEETNNNKEILVEYNSEILQTTDDIKNSQTEKELKLVKKELLKEEFIEENEFTVVNKNTKTTGVKISGLYNFLRHKSTGIIFVIFLSESLLHP